MRKRTALVLLAVSCLCFSQAAHAQLLQLMVHSRVKPMPGSKVWGRAATKDILFPLHYHSRIRPASLLIGRDHPNGMQFLALFPGYGVPLPLKFDKNFQGFDDYGDLKPGYFVEVAEHRFENGSEPEIVIAIGDGLLNLSVNVIKYHAPQFAQDADRAANWTLEGSFSGQAKAEIEGDTIDLPFGSQGLYQEYTWVKGRFLKTD